MASIPLTGGFSVIPEGTHVFQITDVQYKEAFGKLEITMKTKDGQTHKERYSLMGADKQPNQKALNAFSFFAKTAMNDFNLTSIDHTDLVGKFIKCEVTHDVQPNINDPSRTVTFVRLGDKAVATGFEETAEPAPTAPTGGYDLASLLG